MEILQHISEQLQKGEDGDVRRLTQSAVDQEITAQKILRDGLIAGMTVVGERFRDHEIFLPDVLLAAKAMTGGLEVLQPHMIGGRVPSIGKVVLGTVKGDLHDIGKNLVGIMLQGAGYEVIDLGHDVAPERFLEAAREQGAAVIGMSALLTTTMPAMRRVVDLLAEADLKGDVRTIIGGAPVSQDFADEIGADAYAYDAAHAVEQVKALTRRTP